MLNNLRPQPYRSVRAVAPSQESPASRSSYSLITSIRILLGITASIMIITTLSTLFMFHSVDSTLHTQNNVAVDPNGETTSTISHGVHNNVQLHKQILRQHLEKVNLEGLPPAAARVFRRKPKIAVADHNAPSPAVKSDSSAKLKTNAKEDGPAAAASLVRKGQEKPITADHVASEVKSDNTKLETNDKQQQQQQQQQQGVEGKDDDDKEGDDDDTEEETPKKDPNVKLQQFPPVELTADHVALEVKSDNTKLETNAKQQQEGEGDDKEGDDDGDDDDTEEETPKKDPNVKLQQFPPVELPLARGYSGLPMEKTPALEGAKRGTIECDVNVK
jgi:hypothetical protein